MTNRNETTGIAREAARRGFTLVELLVVVAILGILATMAVVGLADKPDQARIQACEANVVTIKNACVTYNLEHKKMPKSIDDLTEGMILPGIVTNITNFGAFVDIGVHQDGLVHISQMANRRIGHPLDIVKLHQHVKVRVIEVDHRRKRISLSMKGL